MSLKGNPPSAKYLGTRPPYPPYVRGPARAQRTAHCQPRRSHVDTHPAVIRTHELQLMGFKPFCVSVCDRVRQVLEGIRHGSDRLMTCDDLSTSPSQLFLQWQSTAIQRDCLTLFQFIQYTRRGGSHGLSLCITRLSLLNKLGAARTCREINVVAVALHPHTKLRALHYIPLHAPHYIALHAFHMSISIVSCAPLRVES